jgi:hypothetical protein
MQSGTFHGMGTYCQPRRKGLLFFDLNHDPGGSMSYTFYKLLHLSGLFLMLLSLGAIASHRLQGGSKENFKNRKFFMSLHGLGLLVSFVAGFGLLAKGGFSFAQGWVYIKMAVWFIAGAYPVVFYKQNPTSKLPLFLLIGLLFLALLAVEYKFI